MKEPLISIIMSTYNDEAYIAMAIESVLKQKYKNFEFIVVDDASTDETHRIIMKYAKKDDRISCIRNKRNLGLTASLNVGLKVAKGEYIARIDSDDIWASNVKLQRQVVFLQNNPAYAIVGTWGYAIDKDNKKLYSMEYFTDDAKIRKMMLFQNSFIHSSVFIERYVLYEVGFYNSTNEAAQDYELWMEIGRRRKVANLKTHMVLYRINLKGISQSKRKKQFDETIKTIKRFRNYYPGFFMAMVFWNLRRYYPRFLTRGISIVKILKLI